jgi:transposase
MAGDHGQHPQAKSDQPGQAKTDRLDARTLVRLAMVGGVWTSDEQTRTLRRLTSRCGRIVRARTRAKNEARGVPGRNLWDGLAGH